MSTADSLGDPPGWHGRAIEDLPWVVVIRVAVCWGVLCMILTLLAAAFLPRPFGFTGTTIVSGSMMPNIQPGDVALVQPLQQYGLGQVILFPDPGDPERQIIHRIVEIRADGMLVTKGDANTDRDSTPVDPATVIGVGRILVPAIGLPIVWAAKGYLLLVIASVLLGALLLRGTLTIEFFPTARKGRVVRAVLESSVVTAMLAVAVLVVVVGVARVSYATFVDSSTTTASWAMAGSTPTPTPTPAACTITDWRYDGVWQSSGIANFNIINNTSEVIPASPDLWVLNWTFTGDEQSSSGSLASSITQEGQTVTYLPYDWANLRPGTKQAGQANVTSLSYTYLTPKDFFLNGAPCDFIPVAAEQLVTIVPPPTPVPTPAPTP